MVYIAHEAMVKSGSLSTRLTPASGPAHPIATHKVLACSFVQEILTELSDEYKVLDRSLALS